MPITAKHTLQVTTPSDLEIVMTRTFSAPRKLVWEAMTKPDLVKRWMFCPPGWAWSICEMDVRVGGQYHWEWNGPNGQLGLKIYGIHKEVTPPSRLVHSERMEMGPGAGDCGGACADGGDSGGASGGSEPWELLATLELTEQAGQTHLKMTLLFPTKQGRDTALASGMEQGVSAGYDNLDQMLAAS